jgi:hypothetical protein
MSVRTTTETHPILLGRTIVFLLVLILSSSVCFLTFHRTFVNTRRACEAARGCDAISVLTTRPLCLLDPTCISLSYSGQLSASGGYPLSQGVAFATDRQLLYGPAIEYLAPLNYALICFIYWIGRRLTIRRVSGYALNVIRAILTACIVAVFLEWIYALSSSGWSLLDPVTLLALVTLALPLYWLSRHSRS